MSIARSVARQPKILVADEPTGNLDVLTSKEIIDLLQKINDYGTTVLVTTHDSSIVNHLKKRVITMKEGKIISDQKEHGIYRLDANNDGISRLPHPGYIHHVSPYTTQSPPSPQTTSTISTRKSHESIEIKVQQINSEQEKIIPKNPEPKNIKHPRLNSIEGNYAKKISQQNYRSLKNHVKK